MSPRSMITSSAISQATPLPRLQRVDDESSNDPQHGAIPPPSVSEASKTHSALSGDVTSCSCRIALACTLQIATHKIAMDDERNDSRR